MVVPHSRIRSALRKVWWMFDEERRAALKRVKLARGLGYLCEVCGLPTTKPEVDHRQPLGPTPGSKLSRLDPEVSWDRLIARLFVPADQLRVSCRSCHHAITHKSKEAS